MLSEKRRDAAIGIALSFVFLLWTRFWLYQRGFAEHDCFTMAAAIVQALRQGTGLGEPMLYFPVSQPFYYLFFMHWPGAAGLTLDQFIVRMNLVSWLAMGGAVGLLYGLARSVAGRLWAIAGVAAVATCQTFFEMGTYGHPTSLALFWALLGLFVLTRTLQAPPSRRRLAAAFTFFTLCFAIAFYTRIDIVFIMPLALALVFAVAPRPWRAVFAASAGAALVVASYPLATRLLFGPQPASEAGGSAGALQTLRAFFQPQILKGIFYYLYAAGTGTFVALGLLALGLALRRRWAALLYGAVMIGLPMVYFLANPIPSRRFMPVIVAGGVFLALGGSRLFRPRRPWILPALAALVVALNLGSPLLVKTACRLAHKDISQLILARLMDSAFDNHRVRQQYLDWDRARFENLLPQLPDRSLLIGQWLELAGLYMNATRQGELVRPRMIRFDKAGHLFTIALDGRQIYYLEWYAGAPPTLIPPDHGPVYILAPLPPDELKRLPAGQMLVVPPAIRHRPF